MGVRLASWFAMFMAIFLCIPLLSTAPAAALTPLLTSPVGGEVWHIGSTKNITWNYVGPTGISNWVDLDYSTDSGVTWTPIQHHVPLSPAQYSWTVPNKPSTHAHVRITISYTFISGIPLHTITKVGGTEQCGDFTIATLLPTIPVSLAAPTNLTATTASSSTISLAWTDKSSNETGFSIERKTGSGSYAEIAKLAANAVTYSDSGLSAGTAYTYRVKAIGNGDNIHNSGYSTEASTVLGQTSNDRLSGQDRYKTAKAIAEEFNNAKCDGGVILASGNDFPDALSASVLSKKLNAPILLVDTTVGGSSEALDYINAHVPLNSTIYFVGGTAVIGADIETTLNATGYHNIKRLGGYDRYDTDMLVVNETNVPKGTPVFVASGENFPDALSVSSFAGSKQYPTLLVGQNTLPEKTKNYIANNLPSAVYIAGGLSVISQDVENQIRAIVPSATVKRLAGNDRFDTTGAVVNEFSANPQTIYLANGYNFPDALSGGALAAKTGNPILLIDHNITKLPPAIEAYLTKLHDAGNHPKVRALGGTVVVPDILLQQAETILDGKPFIIIPPSKVIPLNPLNPLNP